MIVFEAITCTVPTLTAGLQVSGSGCSEGSVVSFDSTCQYNCESGYTLQGDASVTCGSGGTFTPSIPTCDGKTQEILELLSLLQPFGNKWDYV